MPLLKMLEGTAYDSDTIAVISEAYESARRDLGLTDRTNLITDTLARKITEVARTASAIPTAFVKRRARPLGRYHRAERVGA